MAGTGTKGFSGDGGPATSAEFNWPEGAAVDSAGDLFIADPNNNRVREVVRATGRIITVAGDGAFGYSGDGGPATSAELDGQYGSAVTVDSAGDLFIADSDNHVVREVDRRSGQIRTVAGNGEDGYSGDGGPAVKAQLDDPAGMALDSAGDLFIADLGWGVVREVVRATGQIVTVAGKSGGRPGYSGDGGPATEAQFYGVLGTALDQASDLFIADFYNNVVREVVWATGQIRTVAGTGTAGDTGDGGPATKARLDGPVSVAVDSAGDLFISEAVGNVVREVIGATGRILTVAGDGTQGFGGDGGPSTSAQLHSPGGVAIDAAGDLFITDTENNRIREITMAAPVMVNPDTTTTSVTDSTSSSLFGQAVTVTATVTPGSPGAVPPGGSVLFTIDSDATVVVPLNPLGQAQLTTATLGLGQHTVTVAYAGGTGFLPSQSGSIQRVVVPANTQANLIPNAVRNRHGKVVALSLSAQIEAVAPAGGVPTGMVSFFVNGRAIGTAALSQGVAAMTVKPNRVLKKAITIGYSGDADFLASGSRKFVLSSKALRTQARPMPVFRSQAPGGTEAEVELIGVLPTLDVFASKKDHHG